MINTRERKSLWMKQNIEKTDYENKPKNANKCKICSMKTYQKDSICVLCKTGIKNQYEELESLLKLHQQ